MNTLILIMNFAKYELSYSYHHYRLCKIVDNKVNDKSDFSNKSLEQVLSYLAKDGKQELEEVRVIYTKALEVSQCK